MLNSESHSKKLKWGLHDLSPLFHAPAVRTAPEASTPRPVHFGVQFLSVCVPDHEGDAFLANAYLASQMVRRADLFASLVSIVPGTNASKSENTFRSLELLDPRISRLVISHQELWSISQLRPTGEGISRDPKIEQDVLVFLEFEPLQFRSLARIALLLDRLVFFVQPNVESLREAYRLIKTFWHLNREIEFFLLFRGKAPSREQKEFLFERFSLITSRFLWTAPGWLGEIALPEKKERKGQTQNSSEEHWEFNAETIIRGEGLKRPLSPEKNRFWNELHRILQNRMVHHLL